MMNKNLCERFGRSTNAYRPVGEGASTRPPPPRLNERIREYFDAPTAPVHGGSWLQIPEIPSTSEILGPTDQEAANGGNPQLPYNLPKGKWDSKENYLRTHYELLREGAIGPLREIVQRVRQSPESNEDYFEGINPGIYERVRICGITCSTRGIAIRVTFSVVRSGKKILWEQSKRLITGGLVVITPKSDAYSTKAVVATVAARPLAGLQQNPPEIDLFIARPEELEIDPAEEFIMVENRGGLYEADRHTLLALQRMIREPLPLVEHLVDAEPSVARPHNLDQRRLLDMSGVIPTTRIQSYHNVDVLNAWPEHAECQLDETQLDALRRMLTKRLAVVQGPPGTGKTFVSVQAIRILLANRRHGDPPIIIACQTNHAIDQILHHISQFEDKGFIRLGGRCKGEQSVLKRTLYEVRKSESNNPVSGSLSKKAIIAMRRIDNDMEQLLAPLQAHKMPLDLELLVKYGLLTEGQRTSMLTGASKWQREQHPFSIWLGSRLVSVSYKQEEVDYGFEYEEADIEYEQLQDLEAENLAKDDEDFDTLKGTTYPIAENYKAVTKGPHKTATQIREALMQEDLWNIKPAMRPYVYQHLQKQLKDYLLSETRKHAKEYDKQAFRRRIGGWEQDETLLKEQKVLGMTTTGLSKYRGLLASLGPTIVLIEEAAETLEAPVTVACFPSLQQLILVGDHQQLRPHCNAKFLADDPYYFNISLFERLVKNGIEYTQLATQRRMIPEIRRLLYPMYGTSIHDHESVQNPVMRPDVPGMGGMNSFFFTHDWPEQRDDQMSSFNSMEADIVVNFVQYLGYNGVPSQGITVLTFYNGQRKTIQKRLKEKGSIEDLNTKVKTVDSYQGEENEVVILSLVRSNECGQIGFLNNINRVCVALSRAKRGFYMFGNGTLLFNYKERNKPDESNEKPFWQQIMSILGNTGDNAADHLTTEPMCRIGKELVVTCSRHQNKTVIKDYDDFNPLLGGCNVRPCREKLPCGHGCNLPCHPFPHAAVKCKEACKRILPCGHGCDKHCHHQHEAGNESCRCKSCRRDCSATRGAVLPGEHIDEETMAKSQHWRHYSENEQTRHAAAASHSSTNGQHNGNVIAQLNIIDVEESTMVMHRVSLGASSSSQLPRSSSPVLMEERVVETSRGRRVKRKEKFMPAGSSHEPAPPPVKDWSKEASLLD